jgi:hypothetical protein
MALPTFVAAGAFTSSVGAITPALPAGIVADDILLLFLETHQETATVPTPNGGTWTETASSPQGSGTVGANSSARITVFWSRYNGTQGNPTTNDPGNHISGRILAFRGVRTTGDPWNTSSGSAGVASPTATITGGTTTVNDCLIVMGIATEDDGDVWSGANFANASLANRTVRTDDTHTAGDQGHLTTWTGELATAATYNSTTRDLSPSGQRYGGLTLALEPAAADTGGEGLFMLLGVGQ